MLLEKINAVSAQMKARLAETRATFAHSGNKGDHVEGAFRAFLQEYLPRRLGVGHGEVVDLHGGRSAQVDVVVANEDHPFTFTGKEPGLFFLEGVCAGGEVKSLLTSDHLKQTIANSRKWKSLVMKPTAGTLINTNEPDRERFYKSPPFFLVAMESDLSLETVHERLSEEGHYPASTKGNILDAVFLLDRGLVIDFGKGDGSYTFRTPDGASAPGWQRYPSQRVLFDLLAWLSACMPRMIQFQPVLLPYMMQYFQTKGAG